MIPRTRLLSVPYCFMLVLVFVFLDWCTKHDLGFRIRIVKLGFVMGEQVESALIHNQFVINSQSHDQSTVNSHTKQSIFNQNMSKEFQWK